MGKSRFPPKKFFLTSTAPGRKDLHRQRLDGWDGNPPIFTTRNSRRSTSGTAPHFNSKVPAESGNRHVVQDVHVGGHLLAEHRPAHLVRHRRQVVWNSTGPMSQTVSVIVMFCNGQSCKCSTIVIYDSRVVWLENYLNCGLRVVNYDCRTFIRLAIGINSL